MRASANKAAEPHTNQLKATLCLPWPFNSLTQYYQERHWHVFVIILFVTCGFCSLTN